MEHEQEEGEEAQKMAALKRAYADIILNTAKEAATRILVSDRKTLRIQQELFVAKEEALNMLLRLKQVTDSKITELESECLGQKRKVQELEVQLKEAEETVEDLRTELKRMHVELEGMKNKLVKAMDNKTAKSHLDFLGDACQEKKFHTSDSIMCPLFSRSKHVSTLNNKDTSQNWRSGGDCRCSSISEEATTHMNGALPTKDYCASNSDLVSVSMRNKDPAELYVSGCTKKFRASEHNPLTGREVLSGQTDDDQMDDLVNGGDGKAERTCSKESNKTENADILVENSTGLHEIAQNDRSDKGQVVKFFRRSSSRKKRARFDQIEAATTWGTIPGHTIEGREPSNVYSCSESSPCSQGNMLETEANLSNATKEDADNGFESHGEGETIATGNVQNGADNLKLLPEESLLTRQDSEVADPSDVSHCKVNLERVDMPLVNSDSKDEKACKMVVAPTQVSSDRLLKYTFRRKRKREPLSIHKDEIPVEKKNTTKRRTGDKQSALPENQKPAQVVGSSRDSRRLVQVARQLISLSGKRW